MKSRFRISDGKRTWWADTFTVDHRSGVLTLDGKTTVMIFDFECFTVRFADPAAFATTIDNPAQAAALGVFKP